jgi:hypothetical protein
VLAELAEYSGRGKTRVTQLYKHLSRLEDALDYLVVLPGGVGYAATADDD